MKKIANFLLFSAVSTAFLVIGFGTISPSGVDQIPLLFKTTFIALLLCPLLSVWIVQLSINKNNEARNRACILVIALSVAMLIAFVVSESTISEYTSSNGSWRFDQFLSYPAMVIQSLALLVMFLLRKWRYAAR